MFRAPTNSRAVVADAARDLLRSLAGVVDLPGLRVTEAAGGLVCLVLVWPAGLPMPTAAGERRARGAGRDQCRADVLAAVRAVGRPLTRKEVVRALKDAGRGHGPGTVAKALADLTAGGDLVNPRDKRGYRLPEWRRPPTPSLFG